MSRLKRLISNIKVYYQNDGLDVFVEGYIETAEVDPWAQSQTVQVSIICPMPFWQDVKETYTNASNVHALFELPFSTAAVAIATATGEIINIESAPANPIAGLTIYGKTTQDGTPTPENPVELVNAGASGAIKTTVAGKNLAPPFTIGKGVNDATGEIVTSSSQAVTEMIPIPADGTCVWSNIVSDISSVVYFYNENGKYLGRTGSTTRGSLVITPAIMVSSLTGVGGTISYIRLCQIKNANNTGELEQVNAQLPMLNIGATAEPYEPYKPIQTLIASTVHDDGTPNGLPGIPVPSGGNYTDENGQQWICDEIDFARGVYVHRTATADMGTLKWMKSDGVFMTFELASHIKLVNMMCDHYTYKGIVTGNANAYDQGNLTLSIYNNDKRIYVRDDSFNDATSFKTAMSDAKLLYALAEPKETALSAEEMAQYAALHTYKPNTTVYNDAGAYMNMEYFLSRGEAMELSVVEANASTVIENYGTVEAGVTFVVKATVQSTNPRIYNLSTGEFIGVLGALEPGDRLEISTATGSKRVTHIRDGVRSNYINAIMEGSKWLQMAIGANEYSYTVDEGECELSVYHTNMYTGV